MGLLEGWGLISPIAAAQTVPEATAPVHREQRLIQQHAVPRNKHNISQSEVGHHQLQTLSRRRQKWRQKIEFDPFTNTPQDLFSKREEPKNLEPNRTNIARKARHRGIPTEMTAVVQNLVSKGQKLKPGI